MLKQRQQFFVTLLACADAVVAVGACLAAWLIRRHAIEGQVPGLGWSSGGRDWLQQPMLVFAVPMCLLAMRLFGLYRPWRDRRMASEASQVLKASITTIIGLIVILFALGPQVMGGWNDARTVQAAGLHWHAGQFQLATLALALPALLMIERAAFRVVLRELRRRGKNLRHVAIIGSGRLARICCRTLDRNAWTGIHVAYFVRHAEPSDAGGGAGHVQELLGRPIIGHAGQVGVILEQHPVDAVYLALPNARAALVPALLRTLERFPVDVRIIPDVSPRYTPLAMTVSELEGMPILSVRESPMAGMRGVVKRGIDIAGSIAGLMIFALPMLIIAGIIRATSPGPVIFRQRRVSIGGEEFDILKFRTMRHVTQERGEAGQASWTTPNDPRVTSVGRVLRRTSLDELPQLFNVLLGDMSLVGPRPERPELIARFKEDWRGYMLRQHVKAGMTGWAQVNGHRGDTGLRKRLQHDLFYIRHWSLGFDIKILWLTMFRGFVHRNAH